MHEARHAPLRLDRNALLHRNASVLLEAVLVGRKPACGSGARGYLLLVHAVAQVLGYGPTEARLDALEEDLEVVVNLLEDVVEQLRG